MQDQPRPRTRLSALKAIIMAACLCGLLGLLPSSSLSHALADNTEPAKQKNAQRHAQRQTNANTASNDSDFDASPAHTDEMSDDTAQDTAYADKPQAKRRGKKPAKPAELTEEDMPEALVVLHDYRPELVKRFEDWAKRNPENARQMLSRSVPMMQRLIRMRSEDPEGYRLAIADLRYYRFTAELSKQLHKAQSDKNTEQIEELSDKLRTLLTRHFDVRQKIRTREIQKLQDRLDQLHQQMDRRTQSRDKILEGRFKQLSDPNEKATW